MLLNSVSILPTGNEIISGTVIDTDSAAIMQIVLDSFPKCRVLRLAPVADSENEILEVLEDRIEAKDSLVILVGGSGGGHRFVPTLGKDYTHTALTGYLKEYSKREIYGKNGHLWSEIVAGKKGGTLVVNVPGPHVEAVAAASACIKCVKNGPLDLQIMVAEISGAVFTKYFQEGEAIEK